jgi:hypothetical protein
LVFSQFSQFAFCAILASDLFVGELPIRLRPSTSFPWRCFCICNNCFRKRLKVRMSFPRTSLFSPDFNELNQFINLLQKTNLRSWLIVADDVILVCNTSQIFVSWAKEPGIEMIFLRFGCENGHLICSYPVRLPKKTGKLRGGCCINKR